MNDRTLYFCENTKGTEVRRDGPSIWVRELGRAGYRVPYRLIGRVVVIGDIVINTAVITLFSENGVPVLFISRLADEIAFMSPVRGALPGHYMLQKTIRKNEAVIEAFSRWSSMISSGLQKEAARTLCHSLSRDIRLRMGAQDYEEIIDYLKPSDEKKWNVVRNFIAGLLRLVIVEELCKAGLDPHPGILHDGECYGLASDICTVLRPEIDVQALHFFGSSVDHPVSGKKFNSSRLTEQAVQVIVRRFENNRLALHRLVASLIEDLISLTWKGSK